MAEEKRPFILNQGTLLSFSVVAMLLSAVWYIAAQSGQIKTNTRDIAVLQMRDSDKENKINLILQQLTKIQEQIQNISDKLNVKR